MRTFRRWKLHLSSFSQKRVQVPTLAGPGVWLTFSSAISPDTWTVDELMSRVGAVSRSAALKALATWVDMHVLKEDNENVFRLLSTAEEPSSGTRTSAPRPGIHLCYGSRRPSNYPLAAVAEDELPPVMSIQQQQAEQMRVYWKVRKIVLFSSLT